MMRSAYEAVDSLDFMPMVALSPSYTQAVASRLPTHRSSILRSLTSLPLDECAFLPIALLLADVFTRQDEFQVKFWKFRQSEWEPYKLSYSPLQIRLGELTDPLYFDFIQYAQYTIIGREMPKGRQVFEVQVPEQPCKSSPSEHITAHQHLSY